MPRLAPASREDRRTRILDAAKTCFARDGFHATSMQRICAAAGMSAGNLYRYFPSKDALIEGMSERDMADVAQGFDAARAVPDVFDAFEAMLRAYLWKRPVADLRIWSEIHAEAARSAAIATLNRRIYDFIAERAGALLAASPGAGALARGARARIAVGLMVSVFDGLKMRRAVEPEFDPRPQIAALIAMLRAEAARPASSRPARKSRR
jgi:TetR/AcrR family transcriptional repressor of uid operon